MTREPSLCNASRTNPLRTYINNVIFLYRNNIHKLQKYSKDGDIVETLRGKSIFFRKMIVILSMIFILSTIVLPVHSHASIVNEPAIKTDFLDVNSPIVLEFDKPIEWNTTFPFISGASSAHYGITLWDISSTTPSAVSIILQTSGKKLIITPNTALKKKNDYKLEITDHIVLKLGSNGDSLNPDNLVLPSSVLATPPLTYKISTKFLTFKELMSGSSPEINSIIQDYTPRKINVTAPERFVEELSIIHKRQALVQNNTTESVTNVDISINNKIIDNANGDVKRIVVTPKINGVPISGQTKEIDNINAIPNSGRKLYDFGFTRLPDTSAFDIEVILYDDNDDPLDVRIVKVPYETNNTTTIKKRDRYRFAGRTFTLYDLLNRPGDLQTLLDENRMDEIKVRVVQQ